MAIRPPFRLPLTEASRSAATRSTTITPDVIRSVVGSFYARCRSDRTLGPIFDRHVRDWDAHLDRICAFWEAAVLRTGGYSGRPLEAHLAIPDLAPEQFTAWLRLFRQSLESLSPPLAPEDVALLLTLAGRMANRIRSAATE
jgi:hemoglobin